jgi:hypothetical protein
MREINFEKLINHTSRKDQILFCLKDIGKTDDNLNLRYELRKVKKSILQIEITYKRAKFASEMGYSLHPEIVPTLKPIITDLEDELKKFNFILELIEEELLENENE